MTVGFVIDTHETWGPGRPRRLAATIEQAPRGRGRARLDLAPVCGPLLGLLGGRRVCSISRVSMTRKHTIKLMGQPTRTGTDQLEWSRASANALYAFFDEDWRVRQLDINKALTGKRQRARLKCADTREAA